MKAIALTLLFIFASGAPRNLFRMQEAGQRKIHELEGKYQFSIDVFSYIVRVNN